MTTLLQGNYPPKGWLKLAFRLPLAFYRVGLGGLFGSSLVLSQHQGRVSGAIRHTLVECIERDAQRGSVTVVAGYGERTQWYQNLRAHPATTIQVGSRTLAVNASFVAPDDGVAILARAAQARGRLPMRVLFRTLGYDWDGTDAGLRRLATNSLRFVRFEPRA